MVIFARAPTHLNITKGLNGGPNLVKTGPRSSYLLPRRLDLFGRCVKADAATLLTFAGVLGLRSSSLALVATLLEVCSVFFFDIVDRHVNSERVARPLGPKLNEKRMSVPERFAL